MNHIVLKDLEMNEELDRAAMASIKGGKKLLRDLFDFYRQNFKQNFKQDSPRLV